MPRWFLATVFAFTVLLGVLTLYVLVKSGPDVLVVMSLIVLAIFGFGALGALLNPPPGD